MKIIRNGMEEERNPILYFKIKEDMFLIYQNVEMKELFLSSVIEEEGRKKLIKPKAELQGVVREIIGLFVAKNFDIASLLSKNFWMELATDLDQQTLEEVETQKIMLSGEQLENILYNENLILQQRDFKKEVEEIDKRSNSTLTWLILIVIICMLVVSIYLFLWPKGEKKEVDLTSKISGDEVMTLEAGDLFVDPSVNVTENGVDVTSQATISVKITKDSETVSAVNTKKPGTYVILYSVTYGEYHGVHKRTVIVEGKASTSDFTGTLTCTVSNGRYSGFFSEESQSTDTLVYTFVDGKLAETYEDTTVGVVDTEGKDFSLDEFEEIFRNSYCENEICDITWDGYELTSIQTKTTSEEIIDYTKEELIQAFEEHYGEEGLCQ